MARSSHRLLDALTGWDSAIVEHLTGLADPAGIRLAAPVAVPGAVHVDDLVAYLPPARAAWDRTGRLFVAGRRRLRVLDPCTGRLTERYLADPSVAPSAVSLAAGLLAVADAATGYVDLLRAGDLRTVLRLDIRRLVGGRPQLVALTPWSVVAVVTRRPHAVALVGLDGIVRLRRPLPEAAQTAELGVVCGPELVLTVRVAPGWRQLFRLEPSTLDREPLDPARLRGRATSALEVAVADDETWTARTVVGAAFSFDANGEPPPDPAAPPLAMDPAAPLAMDPAAPLAAGPPVRRYATDGRMLTRPVDSGLDDCVWHRIRLDAEQPPGTWVQLRVATTAEPTAAVPEAGWQPVVGTDALIRQPPGRYLRLDLRLHGDGSATPVVPRVRVDFDAATSLDLLPEVYRADPDAAEFTRRFLALFDATLDGLDDAVGQAPLLFHADRIPDRVIGVLARLSGIRPDPSWPASRLRDLLARWPEIWPLLGTPDGLRRAVSAVYGVDVVVEELGMNRPWAALGGARLGQVRLFGAARATVRLGTARLGVARLDPRANPLAPALGSGAYQCVVHVPAALPATDRRGVEALVRAFTPAHVTTRIRYARAGMTVGGRLLVGVDTGFGGLPPGVLGDRTEHAVVLRRRGPLAAAGHGAAARGAAGGVAVTVGRRRAAGMPSRAR